jgi:hypothetical protein
MGTCHFPAIKNNLVFYDGSGKLIPPEPDSRIIFALTNHHKTLGGIYASKSHYFIPSKNGFVQFPSSRENVAPALFLNKFPDPDTQKIVRPDTSFATS